MNRDNEHWPGTTEPAGQDHGTYDGNEGSDDETWVEYHNAQELAQREEEPEDGPWWDDDWEKNGWHEGDAEDGDEG